VFVISVGETPQKFVDHVLNSLGGRRCCGVRRFQVKTSFFPSSRWDVYGLEDESCCLILSDKTGNVKPGPWVGPP